MSKSHKKTSTLSDLDPVTLDKTESGKKEADSVKGGRKAGAGQQEYIKMEIETVIVSGVPPTTTQ